MNLKCKWCLITFSTTQRLQEHLKMDLPKHQYYCQSCSFTFKSFTALQEHFLISPNHSGKDVTEMMDDSDAYCCHCRRQFKTPGQLLNHFSTTHNDDLRCKKCDTWFRYRTNLAQHLASPVHDVPSIPCPHCSKLLKTTSGVAHHLEFNCLKNVTEAVVEWDVDHQITNPVYTDRIREIDSDDEDDDDVLVTRTNPGLVKILDVLATELTWNSAVQAYVCPVPDCYQRFAKLPHLNQHLHSQKHRTDPRTFRCPKCESPFSVVSALIQHLESGSCGLAESQMVKEIYTGLHDMFKRLLKF